MASPASIEPFGDRISRRANRSIERRLGEMNQLLWDFVCSRTHLTAREVFIRVQTFAQDEAHLHHRGHGVEPEQIIDVLEAFADAASVAYAGQHGISSATLTLNYLGLIRDLAFGNPHLEVASRWRSDVERLARSADDPDLTTDGLVVLMSYGGV